VTASHCGALAAYDDNHAARVIDLVREAEITICSNAQISLVLDGRGDRGLPAGSPGSASYSPQEST
jgi:cytosine deaminase